LKIHFNIFLPSTPWPCKCIFSFRFLHQSPLCTFPPPNTFYMPRPSHSYLYACPNKIRWGLRITKFLIMQSSPFPYYLVLLGPKCLPPKVLIKLKHEALSLLLK
jgi:hypothetical protein